MPRCPAPYCVAGGSKMRSTGPTTGHRHPTPTASAPEAALVRDAVVHPAPSLLAVCAHLAGRETIAPLVNRLVAAARAAGTDVRESTVDDVPVRIWSQSTVRNGITYVVQVVGDRTAEERTLQVLYLVLGGGGLVARPGRRRARGCSPARSPRRTRR